MGRTYGPMLDLAEELARYEGYISPEEDKQRMKLESSFAGERRKFVYDAIKEGLPTDELIQSVDADLDRRHASGDFSDYAIDKVRTELHRHIEKQAGATPLVRFATRWGPPAFIAICTIVYFYLQAQRTSTWP